MIHLNPCRHRLLGRVVMNDDIAGEELGHAGGVIVHHKFFQLDGKGQILQEHARRLRQDHC